MANKPEILIVHGGWHVPESYAKLVKGLETAGYTVHIPALPSINEARPPTADLYTDTTQIRDYATKLVDSGKKIIALAHSYGGQVATNSLVGLGATSRRGKPGYVAQIIYMAAFALPEGGSMIKKVEEFGHGHLIPLVFDFAEDDTVLSRDPKALIVGPGLTDDELQKYVDTLTLWNGKCMYNEISNSAWREIPVTYIKCAMDATTPIDYQKNMIENMEKDGVTVKTFELSTGHCPNVTKTDDVVNIVTGVAAKVAAE